MPENDRAILVGVADYPLAGYQTLEGPARDVDHFKRWLINKRGGDLPDTDEHIKTLISPDPREQSKPDYPPTPAQFWNVLKEMVLPGGQLTRRDGKLYLYFSGHGFASFMTQTNHAALYMGNAEEAMPAHVCGTKAAEWCRRAGAFTDIILIMDCCRDEQLSQQLQPEPLKDYHNPHHAARVRTMYIYAVPYDRKAHEVHVDSAGGKIGVLTYALVTALECAPLENDQDGNPIGRSSHVIEKFLKGSWPSIAGALGMSPPDVDSHNALDLRFSSSPPAKMSRKIRFVPELTQSATLTIRNSPGDLVLEAHLDPALHSVSVDEPTSGAEVMLQFDGKTLDVELHAEPHDLTLSRDLAPDLTVTFNVLGGAHVVLEV